MLLLMDEKSEIEDMGWHQVDIRCLQLLQTGFHRDMETLGRVATEVGLHHIGARGNLVCACVFGREDYLVSSSRLGHPLA